jgi:hypothetical protein
MPGFDARHATQRSRRTRVVGVVVLVLALVAVLVVVVGHFARHHAAPPHRPPTQAESVPRVVSTLASWRLGAPISRTVVVPGAGLGDQLVILGGMTTGGLTASGAFALTVSSGALTQVGDLTTTLDDAAGAVIQGQDVVFGGTSSTAASSGSASVQALSATAATGTGVPTATVLGALPQSRAGATAVTEGTTTYLVGGDATTGPDPDVLATTDGRHFAVVASLPVPVQFPAVAAVGTKLYVFGGLASGGPSAGQPVRTIQVVDITTHKVTARWRVPEPLTGAAAVVLGPAILLVGGDTASTGSTTPTTASIATMWSFDPTTGKCTPVGQLPVAVAYAGVAVLGSTAWIVGGESNGTPVSAVQSFVTAPSTTRSSGSTATTKAKT